MDQKRTSYVYEFTYSSAPGQRETFQCKYLTPDEALVRFRKILALSEAPFDLRVRVYDEATNDESSFHIVGSIADSIEKIQVFLETSTGINGSIGRASDGSRMEPGSITKDELSNYDKVRLVIFASFRHGKFSSFDVVDIYASTFGEDLPKSTASTYLARMWNDGEGVLERHGSRSGYTYRLRTELPEVQEEIEYAEELLSTLQLNQRDNERQ
ncbi:MAG: hypothetical protein QXQ81_01560 [Candidatus Thorarchaeota archaeon]